MADEKGKLLPFREDFFQQSMKAVFGIDESQKDSGKALKLFIMTDYYKLRDRKNKYYELKKNIFEKYRANVSPKMKRIESKYEVEAEKKKQQVIAKDLSLMQARVKQVD